MDWVSFTAGSLFGGLLMGMVFLAVQFLADAILGYPARKDSTTGQGDGLRYSRSTPERSYGRFDDSDF